MTHESTPSQRLYYTDSYMRAFAARIIERTSHDGLPAVVLDTTYFYPTGGGQPHDTGSIGGVEVRDVLTREHDKAVLHVLSEQISGDEVDCTIDWARRFDHMQHHTGQHLLTQAFVQTTNAQTVGFHLSADTVTIDLDRSGLTASDIEAAEALANQIVTENRPITARIVDPDAAEGVRMRRLPEMLLTSGLRVIDIDGFDVTACGGTHVRMTGEIGMIKVVKAEKRGDKLRIEFKCGGRALLDYRTRADVLGRIAGALNAHYADADTVVAKLQEDYKAAVRALKTATSQLIELEAEHLLASGERHDGVMMIAQAYTDRDPADLKVLAQRLTAGAGVIALLGVSGERAGLVFARSADQAADMGALLKGALSHMGAGRGGGSAAIAQGGGAPATPEQVRAALDHAARALKA